MNLAYQVAAYDRVWYHTTIKLGSTLRSQRQVLNKFRREADQIVQIFDEMDWGTASDPVRVARLVGMEPISCGWSPLMVLDHLCRFNRDMVKLIVALTEGTELRGEFADELYEPDIDVDSDVLIDFQNTVSKYDAVIRSKRSLKSRFKFRHSWLGMMNAHQWHCWTADHMKVHRRHLMKILSVAGVV